MSKQTDTNFIYFADGEAFFGNINDYCQAKKNSFYAGFDVPNYVIYYLGEEAHRLDVEKKRSHTDEADYIYTDISIIFPGGDDEDFQLIQTYTIDGRA